MKNQELPSFENVLSAHKRILPYINATPVLTSTFFNDMLNCRIYFKCENFQKVGAFKFRGAVNAVLQLSKAELANGVTTHSSGNHAQALALAGRMNGAKATIIMPRNSPKAKSDAVAGYGADIIFCEPTLQAREDAVNAFLEKSGATFVHPYNNAHIIAGQGTAAKELIESTGQLDIVMAPVGGGGLLSGTSLSAKALLPDCRVIAGEPLLADDASRSLLSGEIQPALPPKTIADGLLTSLGTMTFAIIKENVDEIITVREESIIEAMRLVWERMKIIIEPSSAVPLAAIMEQPEQFRNQKVGLIFSGGNVDFNKLPWQE